MSLSKIKKHLPHKDGDSARTIAWNTLQTVLTIAKETIDDVPVPGVKAALGGLLAVIDTIQVCHSYFHLFGSLNRSLDDKRERRGYQVSYRAYTTHSERRNRSFEGVDIQKCSVHEPISHQTTGPIGSVRFTVQS